MPNKTRLSLTVELAELERTDPAVAEARRRLDELPAEFQRYDRHLAARAAVGKRPMPSDGTKVSIHCGNCQHPREVNRTFIRVLPVPPPCQICGHKDWWTEDNFRVTWGVGYGQSQDEA